MALQLTDFWCVNITRIFGSLPKFTILLGERTEGIAAIRSITLSFSRSNSKDVRNYSKFFLRFWPEVF